MRATVVVLFALLSSGPCFGGEPATKPAGDMDRALQELQGSPRDQKKAVDSILAHTAAAPLTLMFIGAAKALELGRLEDAGFLFYAAQLRSRFDLERFPPVGTGGDSPALAISAVSHEVGAAVNPAVMREPLVFKAVIEKVRAWDVATAPGYDPGWAYSAARPAADSSARAERLKKDFLHPAEGLVTLLNTPEYFAEWKTVQDINLAPDDGKAHPERAAAMEKAQKRLREVEERMGIEGLFYRKSPPPVSPSAAQEPSAPQPSASNRRQAIAQLKALGYPHADDADQYVGSAFQGREDLVRLFLAAGMPVDTPNRLGDHAFLMAIQGSYITLAAEILEAGANPNLPDRNGRTPLIELGPYCDETAMVAAVIKAGGNVKAKSVAGATPLKAATDAGCTEIVRMLKKAGAAQ